MPSNRAAYIETAFSDPFVVREAPYTAPKTGELVVKNASVAINPIDWKVQKADVFKFEYPNIVGTDVAGVVEEVGESVTRFKKGDRVISHVVGLVSKDPANAGFQLYSVCTETLTSILPDSISFERGVVLPLALSTAAHGLYGQEYLALASPLIAPKATGQWIVVWGGSSSVGTTAIQLAVASGYEVVTTSSAHNHDLCKSVGASLVFDYKSKGVEQGIIEALKGKTVAGVYDAISENGTIESCCEIAKAVTGPSKVATVLPGGPASGDVAVKSVFGPAIAQTEVGPAVWQEYVPEALAQGKLQTKPDPKVIGTGLEHVQAAVTESSKGVSAVKLVVNL